jgi:hypothetical protein
MSGTQKYIDQKRKYVKVLRDASLLLVKQRKLRGKYETNRSIKTWSTFFLLKSLSTPGEIKCWRDQKTALLQYCKMSENSFRSRLNELKALNLLTVSKDLTINLVSFKKAAEILGIKYAGTIKIEYNAKNTGKQIFQYYIVLDEIRCNQQKQVEALNRKSLENPLLRASLEILMNQNGADVRKLKNADYFQQVLQHLQLEAFKTGSENWTEISALRADKNRSVKGIKKQYGFRSAQSVSYLKMRLTHCQLAEIRARKAESTARTRLYIPGDNGQSKEGYKYCQRTNRTILFLCDSIIPKVRIIESKKEWKELMDTE